MRKTSNEHTIGDALNQFLEQSNLMDQSLIRRVISEWPQVVGKPMADSTRAVWWQDGAFHVELTSPAWKHELTYRRQELVRTINTYIGRNICNDVKIVM